jgi:hypothetical protein
VIDNVTGTFKVPVTVPGTVITSELAYVPGTNPDGFTVKLKVAGVVPLTGLTLSQVAVDPIATVNAFAEPSEIERVSMDVAGLAVFASENDLFPLTRMVACGLLTVRLTVTVCVGKPGAATLMEPL